MKKLSIEIIAIVLMLVVPTKVMASEITNESGETISSSDEICANESYYISSDDKYRNIMVLDSKTKQILDVFNSNASQLEVVFPENTEDVILVSTTYDDNGILDPTSEISLPITVSNCGNEAVVDEYDRTSILATTSYDGTNVVLTKPADVENYSLTYQFVSSKNAKVENFDKADTLTIPMVDETILQISETYTDTNGKDVVTYYEMEVNPSTKTYFIRNIDSFDVKMINKVNVVNKKLVVITLFLLIVAFILNVRYIRARKAYKKEKINHIKKRIDDKK